MRVRRVGLEGGAVFEVICDDEGDMICVDGSAPGDALVNVEVVWAVSFWNHSVVTETKVVQIAPDKIAWTRLYERVHRRR